MENLTINELILLRQCVLDTIAYTHGPILKYQKLYIKLTEILEEQIKTEKIES